ncbi:MAG TPA: hypothetical protein VK021_01505 [Flavobacteriaceae bacterium]|nr:hypothetical protein [Flavobacteriaceae bacterium]
MGKLIIHRKNEITYRMTEFHVILNNKDIGILENGRKIMIELEKGNYELMIKGGFIKSNRLNFHLEKGETKEFVAESFKKGFIKNYIKLSQLKRSGA